MAIPCFHRLKELTVLADYFTQDFIRVTTYKKKRKKTELIQEKNSLAWLVKVSDIIINRYVVSYRRGEVQWSGENWIPCGVAPSWTPEAPKCRLAAQGSWCAAAADCRRCRPAASWPRPRGPIAWDLLRSIRLRVCEQWRVCDNAGLEREPPGAEKPRGGTRRETWMIADEIHLQLMNAWRSEWMNSALVVPVFFFFFPFSFTTPASAGGTKQKWIPGVHTRLKGESYVGLHRCAWCVHKTQTKVGVPNSDEQ